MGKPKQPDPEPQRVVRALGDNLSIIVSDEEKKYRNKNGPDDVQNIPKDKLKCTVCTKSLTDIVNKAAEPFVHMVLGVLMCKECSSFYGDGYFSVDEDGDDKYCRWCGQGGTLYLCSTCTCAFCKKCIKQNLSRQDVKELESDDWRCVICNPKPLYDCRTICWSLQEYAQAKKNSRMSENEDEDSEPLDVKPKRGRAKNTIDNSRSSRKRKASEDEMDAEKETKRRKSSDSVQETRRKSIDAPSARSRRTHKSVIEIDSGDEDRRKSIDAPSARSRRTHKSVIEIDSGDEDVKPSKTESRKSKKGKVSEPVQQSSRRSTRTPSKKMDEVILSDNEEEEEQENDDDDVKVTSKKPSSKSNNNKSTPKNKKKSSSKTTKKSETPKKSSRQSSNKGKTSDDETSNSTGKRSSRTLTRHSYKDDSESDSKEDKPEKTSTTAKRKSVKEAPRKSLTITKNAKEEVVQAAGFINSALKDVVELSTLMMIRCEKLCTKSVQSTDDVLYVFNKLKQMTDAVHENLKLIEKGVDTKISTWKDENIQKTEVKVEEDDVQEPDSSNPEEIKEPEKTESEEKMDIEESGDKKGLHDEEVNKSKVDAEKSEVTTKESPMELEENREENLASESNQETKSNGELVDNNETNNVKEEASDESGGSTLEEKSDLKTKSDEAGKDNMMDVPDQGSPNKPTDILKEAEAEKEQLEGEEEENTAESVTKDIVESSKDKKDDASQENEKECSEAIELNETDNSVNTESKEMCFSLDASVDKTEYENVNQRNDPTENVFTAVGAVVASDLTDSGVDSEQLKNDTNSINQEEEQVDENSSQKDETSQKSESIVAKTEDTYVDEFTAKTSTESDKIKNGSLENDASDKTDKEKEKKYEHKEDERRKEEDRIPWTPSDDHKSSSRPYQSSSGDRNRYPQDSRWSGDRDRERDRDRSWSRDRYQDRWSGGRGGSPYPRGGGDRWHRGGGWGGGYHR